MRKFVIGVATVGLCVSGFAAMQGLRAQGTPTLAFTSDQVIAMRQSGMALVGGFAETVKAGIAAGADVKQYNDGAEALVEFAGIYPALFPDGTQKGHDTKAKAEIWSDRAGFEKANATYLAAAEKFVAATKSGDKAAFADAWKTVGQSCGGCHRNYKEK